MGPSTVVAEAPLLDGALRVAEREEPVLIQALVAQPAVERLGVGVLHRLPGLDEVQRHAAAVCPLIEGLPSELGPGVHQEVR